MPYLLRYDGLDSPSRHEEIKSEIDREGYGGFRDLADQFEQELKQVEEDGFGAFRERLGVAKQLFPDPGRFSPAWQHIWSELGSKFRWKKYVYETISAKDREGEWQIIIDNPFTTSEVVCYPALSFKEAAYLFGYFKSSLEKNEYIRLQKVVTAIELAGE